MSDAAAMDWLRELALGTPAGAADKNEPRPGTLRAFLEAEIHGDTGPWTADGHEPLLGIIEAIDRAILEKKSGTEISVLAGEQTGKTMMAVAAALQLVADRGRNVGYFLPTGKFANVYGRTRLKRLIARSPYLSGRMRDRENVSRMNLKEFDGHFFYLLGLESILDAISIPLDAIIYDEVDHLPVENQEWSEGRIAASDLRVLVFVSAGYAPGAGIDLRYQDGTQHRWLVDCRARGCGAKGISLEESFPDCVAKVRGRWQRVCPECQAPLDIVKHGRWVARVPQRAKDGKISFRLPSLVVTARELDHVMRRWEKAKKKKSQLAKFRCAELAMPDAGAMQPVTDESLARMQVPGAALRLARSARPRFAGMDTGDLCHFWCHERNEVGMPVLVWAEEIDSDAAESRAADLCTMLGVTSFVVDKKPLTTVARGIAYRLGDIVALQDFIDSSETRVADEEHQGRKYRCLKVHRDESLDDFTSAITDEKLPLVMPDIERYPVLTIVAEHLKNLRKDRERDGKGRAIDRYKKGVANHFGMAGNSAFLAEQIAPALIPFSWTPIDRAASDRSRWKRSVLG